MSHEQEQDMPGAGSRQRAAGSRTTAAEMVQKAEQKRLAEIAEREPGTEDLREIRKCHSDLKKNLKIKEGIKELRVKYPDCLNSSLYIFFIQYLVL